jgi:hypothetical protein
VTVPHDVLAKVIKLPGMDHQIFPSIPFGCLIKMRCLLVLVFEQSITSPSTGLLFAAVYPKKEFQTAPKRNDSRSKFVNFNGSKQMRDESRVCGARVNWIKFGDDVHLIVSLIKR